jgi:hypothetical protein
MRILRETQNSVSLYLDWSTMPLHVLAVIAKDLEVLYRNRTLE